MGFARKIWPVVIFIVPTAFTLAVFTAFPLFFTIGTSFTDFDFTNMRFIGIDNYVKLLKDQYFYKALVNTIIFTLAGVATCFTFSLGLAILLNEKIKLRGLFRALVLLPWIVPGTVAGAIWMCLYSPSHGIINYYLQQLGLINAPVSWLGDIELVLPALIIISLWKFAPWYTVALLAGLQSIPEVLYEAAKVDGAGKLARFRYITLPGLKSVAIVVLSLGVIWRWNHFDIVWFLTGGGPAFASHLIVTYTYLTSFSFFESGYGATISVFSLIFLTIFVIVLTREIRRGL
ncbi:MAG: sugar ABC transporter permease [Nitrososphaeria archaeon]